MFREMAEEMSDEEVKKCMSILVESSIVLDIKRDVQQNAIMVTFRIVGDSKRKKYCLTLLSDSIVDVTEEIPFRYEGQYLYKQYMIAKRYSEYWRGNFFV